jgi:hypothetical protein
MALKVLLVKVALSDIGFVLGVTITTGHTGGQNQRWNTRPGGPIDARGPWWRLSRDPPRALGVG